MTAIVCFVYVIVLSFFNALQTYRELTAYPLISGKKKSSYLSIPLVSSLIADASQRLGGYNQIGSDQVLGNPVKETRWKFFDQRIVLLPGSCSNRIAHSSLKSNKGILR